MKVGAIVSYYKIPLKQVLVVNILPTTCTLSQPFFSCRSSGVLIHYFSVQSEFLIFFYRFLMT